MSLIEVSAEIKVMVAGFIEAMNTHSGSAATDGEVADQGIIKAFIESLNFVAKVEPNTINLGPAPTTQTPATSLLDAELKTHFRPL